MEKDKRFQDCNWLVKLYRYRWYLLIPFEWSITRVRYHFSKYKNDSDDALYTGKNLLSLLIGIAQYKMNWYYTSEEVFERFDIKRNKKKDEKNGI